MEVTVDISILIMWGIGTADSSRLLGYLCLYLDLFIGKNALVWFQKEGWSSTPEGREDVGGSEGEGGDWGEAASWREVEVEVGSKEMISSADSILFFK